jgi:hypothetical protein
MKNQNKITKISDRKNISSQILDDYFRIVPPDFFKTLHTYLFSKDIPDEDSMARHGLFESQINKLRGLFSAHVVELNKRFKKEFPNYLQYRLNERGIPKDRYNEFLNNVDKFVDLVMSDKVPLARIIEKTGVKEWNSFNTPYPLGNRYLRRFNMSADKIVSLIESFDPRYGKYKKRIKITDDSKNFCSSTFFDKKKNIVKVEIRNDINDFSKADDIIHEIGHALDMLEKADAGIDIEEIPKFEIEYSAIYFSHRFYPNIFSGSEQKLIRYNNLSGIASTLFEIDIFQNSDQDFDKVYARAVKRCYPMFKDTSDPFYVLYKRFILRPLGELTTNIIETELYLKEAKTP